jgi:hypothetical protein
MMNLMEADMANVSQQPQMGLTFEQVWAAIMKTQEHIDQMSAHVDQMSARVDQTSVR